jgi:hypothetical protein
MVNFKNMLHTLRLRWKKILIWTGPLLLLAGEGHRMRSPGQSPDNYWEGLFGVSGTPTSPQPLSCEEREIMTASLLRILKWTKPFLLIAGEGHRMRSPGQSPDNYWEGLFGVSGTPTSPRPSPARRGGITFLTLTLSNEERELINTYFE